MSGSSLLRNAVKRVTHKERAQPSSRKRFGLLEKHKDYVERATNFKNKQKYLTSLRRKAENRNEDEFYYHMHNSQVRGGMHREKQSKELDKDTVDLLKTQDLAYIIYKKQIDEKKVEKLQQNVQLVGAVPSRSHKIFVDTEEEVQSFDPVEYFETVPELVDQAHNRLTRDQIETMSTNPLLKKKASAAENEDSALSGKKRKKASAELREIQARSKRAKKLGSAYFELSQQRNLAKSKGSRKKIVLKTPVGKNGKEKEVVVYKWKRERSR
jgi:U3 small nucleolar RNA-associated protein 11